METTKLENQMEHEKETGIIGPEKVRSITEANPCKVLATATQPAQS